MTVRKEKTALIISISLVIILILGIAIQVKMYNNGNCTRCEKGHYEYVCSSGHKNNTFYTYQCDNCGHHIEIASIIDFFIK